MDNDSNQEYFKLTRNKVSLAMWVLINNSLITRGMFLIFMGIDFILQTLLILCLYSQVGAVPVISTTLIDAFDYSDVNIIAIVAIAQGTILILSMALILMLVFKRFSWALYSEKKVLFQIESAVVVIFRSPLLILSLLFILHSLFSFTQVENSFLRYLSAMLSMASAGVLFAYCYIGSYLFNLCIPNEQLPWSDTSHQPYLLQTLFKVMLVLTFKMRYYSDVLIYTMALFTTAVCGYRLYLLLLKSHMFDDTVYRVSILFDFGIIHMMVFFILTAINQGQDYYLVFVAAFMPITCMSGFFVKERCKRVWLSQLMNDSMPTEGDQLLCFLYLVFLYTEENEDSWQQLIRLQQIHYTKCEGYFNSIERKMQEMLKDSRANGGPIQYKSGGGGHEYVAGEADELLYLESQFAEDGAAANENDKLSTYNKSLAIAGFSQIKKTPQANHAVVGAPILGQSQKIAIPNINYKARPVSYKDVIDENEEEKSSNKEDPNVDQDARSYGRVQTSLTPADRIQIGPTIGSKPRGLVTDLLAEEHSMPRSNGKKLGSEKMKFAAKKLNAEGKGQPKMKHMGQSKITALSTNNISEIFSNTQVLAGVGSLSQRSKSSKLISNYSGGKSTFQAKLFDMEIKKGQLRKLVKHYFNGHLLDEQEMGFQLKLVKIYFTYKILKNPYLAHFLLFNFQDDDDSQQNFIVANQRLLNQRYIDDLISIRQLQMEETNRSLLGQVNLLDLLRVNQLIVEFDTSIERISMEIMDFWENLLNQKETVQIFTQGLKISDQIKYIQKLMVEIQEKQSDSESKIYLQMANFYSQVVFKSFESYQMLDKARIAVQVKKLSKMSQERSGGDGTGNGGNSDNQEKCLLMAHISLKKPMKITFINKAALKLLQYSMNEALMLSINNIMPRDIGDSHQFFIDQFMLTGKTRMLKSRRELFMKQQSGTVVPVLTYLFVNNMSRKHMILMFEPNNNLKLFDEPYSNQPSTFLLSNNSFRLTEVSNGFDKVTGVSNQGLQSFQDDMDRQLHCEDFVKIIQADCELAQVQELHDSGEVDVYFKGVKQGYQVNESISTDASNAAALLNSSGGSPPLGSLVKPPPLNGSGQAIALNKSTNILTSSGIINDLSSIDQIEALKRNFVAKDLDQMLLTPVFVMKVIDQIFVDGRINLKLLAFRRKHGSFVKPNGELYVAYVSRDFGDSSHLTPGSGQTGSGGPANLQRPASLTGQDQQDSNVSKVGNERDGGDATNNPGLLFDDSGDDAFMELQSMSSTGSYSSAATSVSVFSTYTQQVNSNVTPKTLRFILNMVLIIIFVMIVSSSLVLSISVENLSRAEISVEVNKHSFEAIDEMTTIRLLLRSLSNIYQGYQENKGIYLQDRQTFYEDMVLNLNEMMRDDANFVAQQADGSMNEYSRGIQCGFLSGTSKEFVMNQSLSQGVNLLVSKVQDVMLAPERVRVIGSSKLPFISFAGAQIGSPKLNKTMLMGNSALQSERDVYFVLNNTNGDLHYQLKIFGSVFSDQKLDEINKNMLYLTGVSLGVIAIILMSGFVVIPLFGKIQNRILELMKLFFAIDMSVKRSIIARIDAFLKAYYKTSQKRQLMRLRSNGGSESNDEFEGEEGATSETMLYQQRILQAQAAAIAEQDEKKKKESQQRKFGKMTQAFGIKGKKDGKGKYAVESLERIEEEEAPKKGNKSKKKQQKKKKGKGIDVDDIDLDIKAGDGKIVKIKQKQRVYNDAEDNTFDSNEEESKEDDAEENKESALKHRLDEIQKQKLEAVLAKEREVIIEFSKYTNRRKIIQALFVVVMLSVMASYFLIKYLISLSLVDKMERSVVDLQIIYGRLACSQNVLNTYVESYFSTDLIQTSNPDFLSLNSRLDACMETERDYQVNIINRPVNYLDDAQDYIRLIESGNLCSTFANLTITYDQCLQISDQIRKQGLSTYYFNIMKSVKQMELDLTSAIKIEGGINKTFVQEQLNTKISTYVDTLILVVLPTQTVIQARALQSISDYFNNQQTILSIIFTIYLSVTVLLAVYFVFSMYVKLRKEMLASNRLLYIIDFESLGEAERQIILKFLVNY